MNPSEPAASHETVSELRARLGAAERALAARDKTIQALVTREKERGTKRHSTYGEMEENTALQQVVARKTFELAAQNARLSSEIEARRAVEAALAKNEDKQRQLFAASREALIAAFPPDWRFASANAAALALFRAKDEREFTAREPWEVSPERQPDGELSSVKARRMIMTAMASGSQFFDWTHRRFDGEVFPATVMLTRVESGKRIGIQGTVRDLTEQKRAQEEVRNAHAQLELMVAHSPAVIFRIKMEGERAVPVEVSANVMGLLGFTPSETLGAEWWLAHVHPDDHAIALACVVQTLAHGTGHSEFRLRHKSGGYRWIEDNQRVVRDASGRPTEIVGVWIDVTERKRAESLARQSEARYRTLIDSARDAIFTIAADGTFTSLNPAVETLIGVSCAAWIGQPFAPMVHPDDLPLAVEMFNRVLHGDEVPVFELRGNPGLGRSAVMEMTLTAQKDEGGKTIGVLGIGRDIIERKHAEAEVAKLHQQLLVTSRQAGMAEVATGVLHNVGNVLNSVNVSATLIAEQVRHSKAGNIAKVVALFDAHQADLAGFLTTDARGRMIPGYLATLKVALAEEQKTVLGELDQLRKNIGHIKDIVSMQQAHGRASGVIEAVACADLVEEALRMNASSLLRHDVELVRDFQLRPTLSTDRHKVMQILINLLRNALHACDEAGRPGKRITVRLTGDARAVRIAVSDNGTGIARGNLTRIFSHGFTTKKSGHGYGLHSGALSAKELGGSLAVHSDGPGTGATFTLELPCKPETPGHEPFRS